MIDPEQRHCLLTDLWQALTGAARHTVEALFLLASSAAVLFAADPDPTMHYTLSVDKRLQRLDARVCFTDNPPPSLVPDIRPAGQFLIGATRAGVMPARTQNHRNGDLETGHLGPGGCVSYALNLDGLVQGDIGDAQRVGRDLLVDPSVLLWRPRQFNDNFNATVRWRLPEGVHIALPWARTADDSAFVLDNTVFEWPGAMMLGQSPPMTLGVSGGAMTLVILDAPHRASDQGIRRWLAQAADVTAQVFGAFPVKTPLVIVNPTGSWSRPVSFGSVVRGGGPAVVFTLHRDAEGAELPGEWVAVHEFFHLGIPWMRRSDAWLSEGMATYYQYVLRGRAGLLTETEVWQKIHEGFGRARRDATGRTLVEDSRDMHRTRAYMPVYWGGTAFALEADIALRLGTQGRLSFDDVVRQLHRCCPGKARDRTALGLLEQADAALNGQVLAPLARRYLQHTGAPKTAALYRKLGIKVVDGKLVLATHGPGAALRRAIASPRR